MRLKLDKTSIIVLLLLPLLSIVEAKAQPGEAVYTPAADVQNLPPIGNKMATVRKIEGGSHIVLSARRVGKGDAETHKTQDVFYYVTAGRGDVIVGRKVEGDHQSAPNERTGGNIVGGKTYTMTPGDILWIPAGVAHQVIVPEGGSFSFVVFRYNEDGVGDAVRK